MPGPFAQENAEIFRFGGGINSRASEDQISPFECTAGENFILDPGNGEFRPRNSFDLVGTAPNGNEIRGFATLRKTNGQVSFLVQAGAQVYSWDGTTFTAVGSVSASAKIRGTQEAFWALDDKVLIADINLAEEVHEWDGTTFAQTSFVDTSGSPFGALRAKYIVIDNERAYYANIFEAAQNFPHLLVASKTETYATVSVSDRPSDSLGLDAPWFLPTPQLKPINGLVAAFNILGVSQEDGDFEKLIGSDATNFELDKLHPDSGAVGVEAVVSTGNDIIYGASSHIESLLSTEKFGDVEFDDLSFKIKDDIQAYTSWTLIYNPRVRRIYCIPEGGNEIFVLHTDFIGTELSPWSRWTTDHPFSFQPTASMLARDPRDGLQYVFMGDATGNIYCLEGSGTADGGTTDIETNRTSRLISANLDAKAGRFHGWMTYRKKSANNVRVRTIYSGEHVRDQVNTVPLDAVEFKTVYNGSVYYGGNFYYGAAQQDRLARKTFGIAGHSNSFQIELRVQSSQNFAIQEFGVRFDEAT